MTNAGLLAGKKLTTILMVAVLALGIWLRLNNPRVTERSPDERTYISYVISIAREPVAAPRELVRIFNLSPGAWLYPIPLRVGYLYMIWAMAELRHLSPEQAGVAVSTAASIVQLLMVAVIGLRFFGRWTALAAVALLGVCPADLTMADRVWCDEPIAAGGIIFLWLCLEIAFRRRGWPWYAALWICGGYFMLIKETAGFFYGFCLAALMIQTWLQHRDWRKIAALAAGAVVTAAVSFAVMACLCGGVPAALETIRHNAQAEAGNTFQNNYMRGPWYSIPLGFWILSPLTGTMCAVACVALFLRRNSLGNVLNLDQRQRAVAWWLFGLITLVTVAITLPGNLMDLRYVSFILGLRYLMAGLGLTYTVSRLRSAGGKRAAGLATAAAVIALLVSSRADYSTYRRIYVDRHVNDLDILRVVMEPFERSQ
jgi:biotin transporter BioY